jgi:hypothetical protein
MTSLITEAPTLDIPDHDLHREIDSAARTHLDIQKLRVALTNRYDAAARLGGLATWGDVAVGDLKATETKLDYALTKLMRQHFMAE